MASNHGRDRGSYKEQRRKSSKDATQGAPDDGMFFGTAPKERKEARETVDKRGINLDKLDLNVLDRDRYNAPKKVGQTLRLIDMAMGADEEEPAQPKRPARAKPRPRPQAARPQPKAKPKPKPRPKPARAKAAPKPAKPVAKRKSKQKGAVRISELNLKAAPKRKGQGRQPPRRGGR